MFFNNSRWFKEKIKGEKQLAEEVDPLKDPRITISGGRLIINNPDQGSDRGRYFCKAKNSYGTINSRLKFIHKVIKEGFVN